jgi:hypothetical protein
MHPNKIKRISPSLSRSSFFIKKLDLDKIVPLELSLQMTDESTTIPICVCENAPL